MSATPIKLEGLNNVREMIASLSPALEKANKRAQNKMAYTLMVAEREQIKTDLNWPNPTTVSSILYKKYGATSLKFPGPPEITVAVPDIKGAGVFVGDLFGGTIAKVDTMLGVQIAGGLPAGPKRSELILMQRGFMRPDQMWVPAEVAPRDKYGNIPGSEWSAALTNLGFNQYAQPTQAKQWAIMGKPGNYIGIWKKVTDPSVPGQWQPWVYFVKRPNYQPRYQWDARADMEVKAQFESILAWYIDDELSKL